jgi:hypothetical protein
MILWLTRRSAEAQRDPSCELTSDAGLREGAGSHTLTSDE